ASAKADLVHYETFDDHIGARWCVDANTAAGSLPQSVPTGNGDGLCDCGAAIISFVEADNLSVEAGGRDRDTYIIARRGLTGVARAGVREIGGTASGTGGRCGGC